MRASIAAPLAGTQAGVGDCRCPLGDLGSGQRSEPLAITQLLLLYHLTEAAR